jgi:hypothetical protein
MVPKIFHRIWVGNNPIPEKHEQWWQAWQRLHPDFAFITWSEETFLAEEAFSLLHDQVQQSSIFAMKADIMRIAILYEYGGIYIDTDMMPINRIPSAELNADFVICESNTAFMASKKNSKSLGVASKIISMRDLSIGSHENIVQVTGPAFIESVTGSYEHNRLPKHCFYPYHHNKTFSSIFLKDLEHTYGAHIWNGSWYDETLENRKYLGILRQGNAMELEEAFLTGRGGAYADVCRQQVEILRDIRGRIIASIHSPHLEGASYSAEKNPAVFSVFKMCLFLKATEANISSWVIGSGDATHNSPLSSSIAIFDIDTIFVEPNHYIKEKITTAFSRNSNIKVVTSPFYESGKEIAVELINTKKVETRNLPDWAENLSYTHISGLSFYDMFKECAGESVLNLMPILSDCYENTPMRSIDTNDLLALSDGKTPDIVSIEATGMEGLILSNLINNRVLPKIISIENSGLSIGIVEKLTAIGYDAISKTKTQILAIRRDFVFSYCDHLFVEYGIKSIYSLCLHTILPNLEEG